MRPVYKAMCSQLQHLQVGILVTKECTIEVVEEVIDGRSNKILLPRRRGKDTALQPNKDSKCGMLCTSEDAHVCQRVHAQFDAGNTGSVWEFHAINSILRCYDTNLCETILRCMVVYRCDMQNENLDIEKFANFGICGTKSRLKEDFAIARNWCF